MKPRRLHHLPFHPYWIQWAVNKRATGLQLVELYAAMTKLGDAMQADFERRFPPERRRRRSDKARAK